MGRITVNIYHILEDLGEECRIAYGRRTAPADVNAWRFGSNLDMGLHVLSTFFKGEHGFASTAQTRRLIKQIREWDPDIIHLHNIHGFVLQVELLFQYLKEAGKPVVWTLHDSWSYTGHCASYENAECLGWQSGCTDCKEYRRTYPYALFCNHTAQNYIRKRAAFTGVPNLTLVTPSQWLADRVGESYLRDYPVRVIPNGIDRGVFCPQPDDRTSALCGRLGLTGRFIILGVANVWTPGKGLDYFYQLSESLPDNVRIVLIGLSKAQVRKLPKRIIGLTRTESTKELAEYYSMANVFVNPTLEDTFPTTNLEALACGTPVITFATGGSPESLDDTCGRVVPRRDIEALRHAILDEMQNPKDPLDCVRRSERYDRRSCFMRYIDLYHELMDQSHPCE